MKYVSMARRGHLLGSSVGVLGLLTLFACGGSPATLVVDAGPSPDDAASAPDAGPASEEDAAVVEAPDAASAPDAWAAPGLLGDYCDETRPCAPELVCDGSFSRVPLCAPPPRAVPGVVAYLVHPYLTVAVSAPLASSDIASVEMVPLDASDVHVGEPFLSPYEATGDTVDGVAHFYVRCVAGAVVTASVTLVDAAGVRGEPMLITPVEAERVESGGLCDGIGRMCGFGACTESADGEMRCP